MLYEMNIASFSIKEVFSYIMVKRQRNWNNCMQNTYKEFMKDIRKALKMRVKLTDIYPPVDDEF